MIALKRNIRAVGTKLILTAIILALLFPAVLVTGQSNAYADETATIKVKFFFPNAKFVLYKIGSQNEDGSFDLSKPYSTYNVNLNSAEAASTLTAYVQRDGLKPDTTAMTNENGKAIFTDLERGVYLMFGNPVEYVGEYYTATPTILVVPSKNAKGDTIWNQTVENKYQKVNVNTSLKVRKVWKSDDADERPDSITVQLLCDGALSDREDAELTLNSDNNWTHTWKHLEKNHIWSTVEKKVPKGYTVNNEADGNSIAVINTSDNPPDDTPPHKTLPHTGQYWMPALELLAGGLLLILLGLLRRARN